MYWRSSIIIVIWNITRDAFFASIVMSFVPYSAPSVVSISPFHHESSTDMDEVNSSCSPMPPLFFLSHHYLDCIPTSPGEQWYSAKSPYDYFRYGNRLVITIWAWSPNGGYQPKIALSSFHVLSTEWYSCRILAFSSLHMILDIGS